MDAIAAARPAEPDPLSADLTPSDRLLLQRPGLAAAHFRATPGRAEFAGAGPLSCWLVVFPRNFTQIRFDDGSRVMGNPAEMVLYNRGDAYRRRAVSREGDFSDYLALDEATLREALQAIDARAAADAHDLRFARRTGPVSSTVLIQQRRLFAQLDKAPPRLGVDEALVHLLLQALAGLEPLPPKQRRRDRSRQLNLVEAAKQVLIEQIDSPPDLTQLGQQLHSSPFHLARTFLRHTGYTLHGFVQQQRLRLGFDQLSGPPRRIADLAIDLGFAHHSHFSTQFRREFGLSPRELRGEFARLSAAPADS